MGITLEPAQKASQDPRVLLAPERLHKRYAPRIRRHVAAVMGPDYEHEDLVQEVLLVVLSKVNTVRDPNCLDWWVAQVTANTLKQLVRRRRLRRHARLDDVAERQIPAPQADFQTRELATRALRVITSLPANDRALLTSYWLTPATAETIAAQCGCSVVTVRRRLSRARSRFEKLARRDPALASCIDDARGRWRRRRATQKSFFPTSTRKPARVSMAGSELVA